MNKIDEVLTRGVEKIYPDKEGLKRLMQKKKIRLYQGFDPSMPNLHLGNLVGLLKLKQFQDLGHEVICLIGDFTGMIGDPTDKISVRPQLTREEALENAKNWKKQIGKVLNFYGKNPAKLIFNSQWLDKISFKDLIKTSSYFTVQQMIERDFFQRRLQQKKPIFLHEFLYPVAQAIDCLELDVDLEIGGTDQTFNMLAGRTLMKAVKGKEKYILTTKLLVDAKGKKVGKTAGNALFLNATPNEMFGGIMSFPDEVIILSFELLTDVPLQIIKSYEKSIRLKKINPMELKKKLAFEIVKLYYSEEEAKNAKREFELVFQRKGRPRYPALRYLINKKEIRKINIIEILTRSGLISSRSKAKKLVIQRGVDIDGKTLANFNSPLNLKNGSIIRVGKKNFVEIEFKK